MVTIGSSEIAEILSHLGFDWLFLDGEHSPLQADDIKSILLATGGRLDCLVRIPGLDEIPIKKALDLGATGIIAPQINTPDQAAQLVQFCRYPPQGSRGTGLARAHTYGLKFQDYLETANDQIVVVAQAEHKTAVDNIEAIVDVPGIDCVYIGPYDLSASFGVPGQIDAPSVVAAIHQIESVCKKAQMPLGIFGISPESVQPYIKRGFSLVTAGIDSVLFSQSANELLGSLQLK